MTQILKMEMLSNILGYLLSGGVIALIIVFQQEIRKFLLMIGTTNMASRRNFLKQINFLKSEISSETDTDLILSACRKLSITKTGALTVFSPDAYNGIRRNEIGRTPTNNKNNRFQNKIFFFVLLSIY